MTTQEAYKLTMDTVLELVNQGFEVKIKPSSSRFSEKTLWRYNDPNRLPSSLWKNVSFKINSKEDFDKVFKAGQSLRAIGINFDTGSGCGTRDWELDWSFKLDTN